MATCLKYSIQFLNYSVNFIDQLPNSISENIRFGILDTWLVYLFIASLITLIVYRKFIFLLLGGTFLSFFLISTLWTTTKTLQQRKLIIYNIPKHTAINFIDGVDNFLITNKSLIENKKKLMFHVQNNWINNGLKKAIIVELKQDQNSITKNKLYVKSYFFQFHELKIALIDRPLIVRENQKKLQIDLLILTKNNQLSIAKLLTQFNPKQIIIDPSNTKYQNNKLLKEAQKLKVNCWSVLTEGYYECQLKDLKSI
jgi:competence protein ComEC